MEPAPLFTEVADAPPGGAAHWVTAPDGLRLRVGHWPHPRARGTVLIFPGRTEYIEKYGRDAGALAERGYAAAAIDWRGQGISARMQPDRLLGHVNRFADYQADADALMAYAEAVGLPRPYLLLAHSMGGCIGLRALMRGYATPRAVFSAPMWGIRMQALKRSAAWGLSALSKPLRFSHLLAPGQSSAPYVLGADPADNTLTTDPDMLAWMKHQIERHTDLALGGPSLHWLHEALSETRALARMPAPEVPTLTFLGSEEAIVDPARITARMARWPGGRLVTLEGAQHEVLMETPAIRTKVLDAIAAHFAETV
ncbi:alpha/beta hydrolase [Histidinibacterium lentulum]|uniref:Alpha/beta hydrolase n=1 Tax=Histidinibacterium lentulum TaxID=2480588 RepID=A0A3N2R7F7_9RHOB|nr:alpha/beta hydrolase [Histidinibacterium lentulum]